jgi:hypothetical protein
MNFRKLFGISQNSLNKFFRVGRGKRAGTGQGSNCSHLDLKNWLFEAKLQLRLSFKFKFKFKSIVNGDHVHGSVEDGHGHGPGGTVTGMARCCRPAQAHPSHPPNLKCRPSRTKT